jgi:peptide deformylase
MVYDVVLYPDAPLRDVAKPVEIFDDVLVKLAEDMVETMDAYEGVGLAAPQIGLSCRMLVLCEPDGEPMCLINPEILAEEGKEQGDEGCLSMPRIYGSVPRATSIQVKAFDEHGKPLEFEAHDFLARIIQHEVDHLNGVMFPDRLDIFTRDALYKDWEEIRAEIESEAKRLKSQT